MTRTERTYLAVFGGYNLAQFLIAPVYPLFLLGRGLDLFQINVVLAVYLLTVVVLEIPTGAFADRYGRRRSFIIACLVRAFAYGLYSRAGSFADCLVAEMIDAFGTTLASGSLEAWAVDGVRAEGDRRPADRLLARGAVVARVAVIVGVISCGYLADTSLVRPWLIAMTAFLLTALGATLAMRESPAGTVSAPHAPRPLSVAVRQDLGGVLGHCVLLLLCLVTAAGAFGSFPLHTYWSPHLAEGGVPPHRLGWIAAALNLAGLLGSAGLPRLLARARRSTVLAAAACWRAATLALAAAAGAVSPLLAGLVLQEVAFGLTEPVLAGWTNEHVPSERRATLLSVRSTFFTLGGAAGLVAIGLVGRAAGVPAAWAVSAAVFAGTVPGYLLLERAARRVSTPATVPA